MEKIYVNVITRHMGHWAMFSAFQQAAGEGIQHGYQCLLAPHIGDSLVSRARNDSLAKFLETDCEYYFTLDDDIAVPHDVFHQLISADKGMIGGFYRLKKRPDPTNEEEFNMANYIAFRGIDPFTFDDGPIQVQYISTGCVMHKRSFIEDMVKAYPHLAYKENVSNKDRWALYQPYVYHGEYLSEDWAFCQRALNKGHKLWMHPQVRCDHWGLDNYSLNDLLKGSD